jgi:hypothetical protein
MPKAYVSIVGVDLDEGKARLIYRIVVERDNPADSDPSQDVIGQDFTPDSTKSMQENENALKDKIANHLVSHGMKLSTGDVILYGAPIVKDSASFSDSTNGITSDRTAITKEPETKEEAQPGLMARMASSIRNFFSA